MRLMLFLIKDGEVWKTARQKFKDGKLLAAATKIAHKKSLPLSDSERNYLYNCLMKWLHQQSNVMVGELVWLSDYTDRRADSHLNASITPQAVVLGY